MSEDDDITDLAKGVVGDRDWVRRWREGQTAWHKLIPDPYLSENGPTLFGDTKKRFFLPLCGKSVDLLWLYEQGHEVVGVELAVQPVNELYNDNNLEHTIEVIEEGGEIYKSKDGRLTIFRANLFRVPKEKYGKFDVVLDKQSFSAINLEDHIRYRDLMYAIMKQDTVYLLKTLHYDEAVWPGPPHSISDDVVKDVFGEFCNIELLEEVETAKQNLVEPKPEEKHNETDDVESKRTSHIDAEVLPKDNSGNGENETSKLQTEEMKPLHEEKDISTDPTSVDDKPKPSSAAQAALKTSSFRFDRWYKLQFK